MAQIRAQIVRENTTEANSRNDVVNTVYFDTDVGTDFEQLGDDLLALWLAEVDMTSAHNLLRVKLYDMADTEPREPRYEETAAITATASTGPREVALCLSYYAGQNTPRRRGRIYLGPFPNTDMAERPSAALRAELGTLAQGLSALGGVNVQWVQYSPTTGDFSNVTNYWIDDEWDTMRSRGLLGTTRTAGTVNG